MPRQLDRPPDWTTRAACTGQASAGFDPWHPPAEDETAHYQIARRVCDGCPVRAECLDLGRTLVRTVGVSGMYGGKTPKQLRGEWRPTRRTWLPEAQHGTRSRYVAGCRCPLCRTAADVAARRRTSPAA